MYGACYDHTCLWIMYIIYMIIVKVNMLYESTCLNVWEIYLRYLFVYISIYIYFHVDYFDTHFSIIFIDMTKFIYYIIVDAESYGSYYILTSHNIKQ